MKEMTRERVSTMQTLKFEGKTLYYTLHYNPHTWEEWTCFYDAPTMMRKKYFFFGEEIEAINNKPIFVVGFNVESDEKTKDEVRSILKRKVELLDRKAQIERGEIV